MFEGIGGYDASMVNKAVTIEEFREAFDHTILFENYVLFESPGMIALIDHSNVSVHYKIPPHQLPACVVHYFKYYYAYSGPKLAER
jgi:hypothetical protein